MRVRFVAVDAIDLGDIGCGDAIALTEVSGGKIGIFRLELWAPAKV